MADVTLSNGVEITFDLYKISIAEYRGLFNKDEDDHRSDGTIAKAAGMTADELTALPFLDYRHIVRAFFKRAANPDDDPNA